MSGRRWLAAAMSLLWIVAHAAAPRWAAQAQEVRQVPASVLAHGVDELDDDDDPMSSPDVDLGGERAWEIGHLVEVAVGQQQAERLWHRHGAPGSAPSLAADHVLVAVRIDHGGASPCHRRRFDAAWDLGVAIDLVLPTEAVPGACDQAYGPGTGPQHDVYVIDLDVSGVGAEVSAVRVSTAFGGSELRYVAEVAVDLPVAPTLPHTGVPATWLALVGVLGVATGMGALAWVQHGARLRALGEVGVD